MRRNNFDVLKAVAIIAVVLYHLGTCEYGYLGVDIFLVIAGYFTSQSVEKQIVNGVGGYFRFVENRIFRLLPLLLIAGVVCLVWGWLMMLPDDLENTAQSIVATNFFGNNILQAVTTKNYWDIVNEYKPLMHTWYVGLIMQFYFFVPLVLFIIGRRVNGLDKRRIVSITFIVMLGVISLICYVTEKNEAAKFYYLPYRLFEFGAGSLAFYLSDKKSEKVSKSVWVNVGFVIIYLSILILLLIDAEYVSRTVKLLITVCSTSVLLFMMTRVEWAQSKIFSNKWIAYIGEFTFSIFVWHQVALALIRYSFTNNMTDFLPLLTFVVITSVLSILSYKYVEQMKKTPKAWGVIGVMLIATTVISLYIYKNAGVIRDVPELEVVKGKVKRGQWTEYCDRVYKYDKDFTNTDKPKWYVIGNSFGRDMVNIILESELSSTVEISYSYINDYKDKKSRFSNADVVFLSSLGVDDSLIKDVRCRCSKKTRFVLVGEKNFGENNGQVYRHRFDDNYHQLTVEMENGYEEKNRYLKKNYSNCFIDMIGLVQNKNGRIPVFTKKGHFISQDCRHLTKFGAQYYASLIDLKSFLKKIK